MIVVYFVATKVPDPYGMAVPESDLFDANDFIDNHMNYDPCPSECWRIFSGQYPWLDQNLLS